MNIDIIGYSAICVAAIATVPQLYQTYNTRQVRDINFFFFFLRAFSSILYLIYGILKQEYIMISSTIMPIILELSIVILYIKYRNNETTPEQN